MRTILNKSIARLAEYGAFNWMDDERYLKLLYWARMGKKLNLTNPTTFNEKLQWLKLHDRKPIYSKMVDKYEAKKYVANIIGEEYIIPTLGVWEHFKDIDFDILPNQFVLKCTHDSGGLVICKDKSKLDIEKARAKIEKSLATNYYLRAREWPYKDVKPRIIAEEYLTASKNTSLNDYKFFCFGGIVKCFKVDFDRFISHHANYFDQDTNILDFGEVICPPDFNRIIRMPDNLNEMMKLAEQLSQGSIFLRADFYDANGRVYFGELTFFPASGLGRFTDENWDLKMGSWIQLPDSSGGYTH